MTQNSAIKVWDGATRLFHWAIVALCGFSWWSAETRHLDWHLISGCSILALVLFRLIWGFVGSSTSRFASFVRSPLSVITYMRGNGSTDHQPGHNPVGGYSVVLLLFLLIAQVGTGLFADDEDGLDPGPLNYLVSYDQGQAISQIHHTIFALLQATIIIHVLAVLFYLVVKKRNLITPMITGKDGYYKNTVAELRPASFVRLATSILVASALAWWTYKGLR